MAKERRNLKITTNRLSLSIRHLSLVIGNSIAACALAADPPASRAEHTNDSFPVLIQVDASQTKGELKPIWRFFGADEPNYATMKNGNKLIRELGELGGPQSKPVYFRAHNLLTSGDGTAAFKWGSTGAYDEDPSGKPIYNW